MTTLAARPVKNPGTARRALVAASPAQPAGQTSSFSNIFPAPNVIPSPIWGIGNYQRFASISCQPKNIFNNIRTITKKKANDMKKISAFIIASSLAVAAKAQLVDSLTSGSTSAYTQTVVLAQSANPLTFASTGSGLTASGNNASAEQNLLLRSDFSLTPGYELTVNVGNLVTSSFNADFGLAIASTATPIGAVWTSGTASTRSNYVAMYVKPGNGQIGAIAFDGSSQLYSSGGVLPTGGYANITGLYISEPTAGTFDVGYISSVSGMVQQQAITIPGTQPGDTSIGTAIGFYADVRAVNTSPADLTALTLQPIPEPTSLALFGLGLAGLGFVGRRKNT